jgi:hypothetical protein
MGEDAVVSKCRECRAGRPHCHGTLIHHWGEQSHCTEADCRQPELLLHSLSIDCDAIGCECGERGGRRLAV